jgi:hypothetical protein
VQKGVSYEKYVARYVPFIVAISGSVVVKRTSCLQLYHDRMQSSCTLYKSDLVIRYECDETLE